MKRIFLIFGLGLAGIGVGVRAQEKKVWTLEECISYALEQNITVRKSVLSNQSLVYTAEQTKAQRFPSVNGSIGENFNWMSADGFFGSGDSLALGVIGSNSTSFRVNSSVTVYNFGKLNNQIKQSELNIESGNLSLATTKESISLSILNAFLQVLYAQEQVKNSEKQIESVKQQLNLAEERLLLRAISQSDYLQIKSQLASQQLTLANAQSTLAITRVNLMQLMELPVDNNFEIAQPNFDAQLNQNRTPDVQEVFAKALEIKPQIKNAEISKQVAALDEKIAKAGYYPSLTASADINTSGSINFNNDVLGYAYAPFKEQLDRSLRPQLSFSLSVPIYQRKQVKTSVAKARINYQNAELSELDTRNQLRKSIEQACQDVSSAQVKYEASLESYNSALESSNIADEKFSQGLINSVDYLITRTTFIVAESQLLQARFNLIFTYKILDFYTGIPLTL